MGYEEVDIVYIVNNIVIVKNDFKYIVKLKFIYGVKGFFFLNLRFEGWDEWGGVYVLIEIKY